MQISISMLDEFAVLTASAVSGVEARAQLCAKDKSPTARIAVAVEQPDMLAQYLGKDEMCGGSGSMAMTYCPHFEECALRANAFNSIRHVASSLNASDVFGATKSDRRVFPSLCVLVPNQIFVDKPAQRHKKDATLAIREWAFRYENDIPNT